MDNDKKAKLAVEKVITFLRKKKYSKVEDVSTKHKGYDIIASNKNREEFTFEVKGTSNQKGGIPDFCKTEFEEKGDKLFLKADFLYVVRFGPKNKRAVVNILTKKEVDNYSGLHTKKIIIKNSSKLSKDIRNGKIRTQYI